MPQLWSKLCKRNTVHVTTTALLVCIYCVAQHSGNRSLGLDKISEKTEWLEDRFTKLFEWFAKVFPTRIVHYTVYVCIHMHRVKGFVYVQAQIHFQLHNLTHFMHLCAHHTCSKACAWNAHFCTEHL